MPRLPRRQLASGAARPNAMRALLPTLVLAATAACAPVYEDVAPEVAMLAGFPQCEHQKLGVVEASDGRTDTDRTVNQDGGGTVEVWGDRADPAAVYADLRRQAAARGGNAVVVVRREAMHDSGAGSGVVRGDSGLRVTGSVIRTRGEPTAAACGAVAYDTGG